MRGNSSGISGIENKCKSNAFCLNVVDSFSRVFRTLSKRRNHQNPLVHLCSSNVRKKTEHISRAPRNKSIYLALLTIYKTRKVAEICTGKVNVSSFDSDSFYTLLAFRNSFQTFQAVTMKYVVFGM
jgi:hypothetical protein